MNQADRATARFNATAAALSTMAGCALTAAVVLGPRRWLDLVAAVLAGVAAVVGWCVLVMLLRQRAGRAAAERDRRVAAARRAERARVVRELHDVLGHRLSLLITYAGAVEFRPDAPAEQLARSAGVLRAGARQALEDLREVLAVLRTECEEERRENGVARPQPTLADLPRLVEECRAAGAEVSFDNQVPDPSAVPPGAGRTAYRIVQEGLTNARKHAGGQPVTIAVTGVAGSRLRIDIRNPLVHGASVESGGTGLIGLAERVQLAGGQVEHGVTAAGEFKLVAALPWPVL